ncbi:MAG: sulfatase-like hydrolase/transferase [Candidatus Eisenbacteria bacterium]
MKKTIVVHPFLLGIFQVLFLFSHNKKSMSLGEIVVPLAVIGLAVALIFLVLQAIMRNRIRAGIIVSTFVVLFFSYGRFHSMTSGVRHRYMLLFWAVLFVVILYLTLRTRRPLKGLTDFMNVVAISLVVISIVDIGVYTVRRDTAWSRDTIAPGVDYHTPGPGEKGPLPDIYYIILDRYGGVASLSEYYDFDNSGFMDYLLDKGFYVATESKANYLKTAHSLASSLNMEYINYLTERVGEDCSDWMPLFTLLQDYKLWRFLKTRGYMFYHFGDWWEPTTRNKYADVNVNYYWLSEFATVLYETTAFQPIGTRLGILDSRRQQWKRIRYKFDRLAEMADIDEPTFVFAHMLVPHSPYVFDRDGGFITEKESLTRSERDGYIDQLVYTNKRVMELIDILIARSKRPPVIVLQSDEGPFPQRYKEDAYRFKWTDATPEELKQKMRILNAYYLPGAPDSVLYSSISPVNSFRVVLNLYFGQDLELMSDEIYAFVDNDHLYKFYSITEVFE